MAGVKGRSGGARPGAGRPKKEPTLIDLGAVYDDPEKFLRAVMNDTQTDAKLRVDAAKALMPFVHPKKGESSGKKKQGEDAAKAAASGKFGVRQGPRLAVNNR